MRSLRVLALLALVGSLAGCGSSDGNGGAAVPGTLTLTLTTPHANDGAILFTVNGVVDSVSGKPMVQSGSYLIHPTFTKIVIAGDITSGPVATLYVPDVKTAASYKVTVNQAAVRTTFAQQTIGGYSIAVTTP